MTEDVQMVTPENFDQMNQRVAHPSAWLDEVIQAIELAIQDGINETTIDGKNKVFFAIKSYTAGIADGNRFMRENPYKNNDALPSELLKRIIY
jgi:hypothetical protein